MKISEFAKLRNIHINSLLYYEKIGILLPAYIDPESKYRYYLPEQIITLDSILFAIELGIPLRKFKSYIDGDTFLVQKFLEEGKQIAETKMANIQIGLRRTEHYLNRQEENKCYRSETGHYRREIEERYIVATPYNSDLQNVRDLEKATTTLFDYAQGQNLVPVIPGGILLQYRHQTAFCYIFLEVLSKDAVSTMDIYQIPTCSFLCVQKIFDKNLDVFAFLKKEIGTIEDKTVLITNATGEKRQFNNRQSEIQIADTLFQI